ncbi:Putative receptor-like protein kinase At1g80870 [Linum grandiflorum]
MPSRALLSSSTFPPPPSPPLNDDHFRPRPTFPTKSKFLFLSLTISATAIIILTLLYFLYHLCHSFLLQLYRSGQARTIPFDAPLNKLKRFTYSELKLATNDFHSSSVIGRGGSATVFRAIAKDGKLYAVKRLDGDLTLHSEQEFQNELQILGGLKSPLLVTLLGYCVEKKHRLLVYEYMPNKSLQELLFGEDDGSHSNVMSWETRFRVILDVSMALEFLHTRCDPPVIHGDIKPSNVLLGFDLRAKIADFGLSRVKGEADLFSQELMWKSQDLSGTLESNHQNYNNSSPLNPSNEEGVDFARALQASSSGKGASAVGSNFSGMNFNSMKDPEEEEEQDEDGKQWGKDWWWRQDGNEELCSKDYVMEWIGSQISPSSNPNWEDEQDHKSTTPSAAVTTHLPTPEAPPLIEDGVNGGRRKKKRKMKEWWKEEHLEEMSKKGSLNRLKVNNNVRTKLKKGLKIRFHRRNIQRSSSMERKQEEEGEFSFRRGWRRSKKKSNNQNGNHQTQGSEMWSGDLFSRELSSTTTSMRGTLCYVAPEHGGGGVSCGGGGYLMEKADIYSLGVLILVIVSGRRPLHVLASPMKLEKANLISWCRQLAHQGSNGDVLEIVDERLKEDYKREEASLCINLALICLQKMPELRPEIGDIVRILKGEMEIPPLPFEFSPSPPPPPPSKSRRKYRGASNDIDNNAVSS